MSQRRKIGVICLMLIMLPVALAHVIMYQSLVSLPFSIPMLTDWPLVGPYIPEYLFWLSSILCVFIIVGILVLVLWPNKRTEWTFQKDSGTLTISDTALSHFVAAVVASEPWIGAPTVQAVSNKKSLTIKVDGQMTGLAQTPLKAQQVTQRIETELEQLLGVSEPKNVHVRLTAYQQPTAQRRLAAKSRVI